MSRWSKEEDANILQNIQVLEEEPNYFNLVEYHNELFNTNRTESTYKARVIKIAKENNIILKSKVFWTEKDTDYIINSVQVNPFDIKWSEMATKLNRSEDSIHRKYNELVTPEEHLDCCLLNLDPEDIINIMNNIKHICKHCSSPFYYTAYIWKDEEYCELCHTTLFGEEINDKWNYIKDYSESVGKTNCNICKTSLIINKENIRKYHYDHINMFEKSNSICIMISTGIDIEQVVDEIDKCQVLCIPCHNIITKVEHMCGFIRVKRSMTKEYNETNDDKKKEELTEKYKKLYSNFMNNAYNCMRNILKAT